MQRMASFEKVSYEQFKKDWIDTFPELNDMQQSEVDAHIKDIYKSIKLPKRATMQSAGNDFFCPVNFTIKPGESIKIPTGIRCEMYDGWVLTMYPRSSHGFKYGLHMANTVCVIDGDYYDSDNEGHIFVKIVNDSSLAKKIKIKAGEGFCQGIFLPFGITLDDDVKTERNGGMGSTNKNK